MSETTQEDPKGLSAEDAKLYCEHIMVPYMEGERFAEIVQLMFEQACDKKELDPQTTTVQELITPTTDSEVVYKSLKMIAREEEAEARKNAMIEASVAHFEERTRETLEG